MTRAVPAARAHIPNRGERMEENIIKTYQFGNTIVEVSDRALPKTKEENERIMQEFLDVAYEIMSEMEKAE